MKGKKTNAHVHKGLSLLLPIVLIFCILGTVIFSVSQKVSREMSESAIQNLSENLSLIRSAIEAILNNEAEFQCLIAHRVALADDPAGYIRLYEPNETMVKVSLILSGDTEGISNTGEVFSEEGLDFSAGNTIAELPVSESYLNYMGTWAYTMKCPVVKDNREIATLYVEYIYDSLDRFLPESFYGDQAVLYIMDAQSERFVLKPKGMGIREAGHLNLKDFYRANSIDDAVLQSEVYNSLKAGKNILFYHDIRQVNSLNYMWPVNDGTIYLVGYVPYDAILHEGKTINQNLLLVVGVTLISFFLCAGLYYLKQRQQIKDRREREAERELHNKQLMEALQAAQIANHSKTMFLSNMSHDIRTPMNAVLGFTTLLARDAENPAKVREYTKKITASGQHLLGLINDILDISKIESGKVVLVSEEFSLNDVISSVDAIIQPMAKSKKQQFRIEVKDIRHERLIGDEIRLNQILINLLSNAVKYTPEGGNIRFRITGLKQRSSQYEHIRIEVEDDGYGMTPEYLKTIFDAFTRAENSTTNKVQGTGLGMAITKNIVTLMGGTIDVSSELGKGSLFTVDIEFRLPEDQADLLFWKQSGITQMMVIDSDEASSENIRLLMKEMNIRVDSARSIPDALQLIRDADTAQKPCQLILLDDRIPDADSTGTISTLQGALSPPALILLLTEHHTDETGSSSVGSPDTLAKPFFVSALKEKIIRLQNDSHTKDGGEPDTEDSLAGLHFLAAEDNEINAEILTELLEMEGATCEIVADGKLAVERFSHAAEGEFDAILMDVQMPVMNGYEATRAIRALDRSDAAQIPIIAMTADAFTEDQKAALDAGMNAHIAKPLDVELVKKVIQQYTK